MVDFPLPEGPNIPVRRLDRVKLLSSWKSPTFLFTRTSSSIGLGLGQASEFSFIIAAQGLALAHFSQDFYSLILSLIVVSIIITPYFMKYHTNIYKAFSKFGGHRSIRPHKVRSFEKSPEKPLKDHVIVFGAGTTGMKVIKNLKQKKQKFIVVEHDPEVAKHLSNRGVYCLFGESDNDEILRRAGLYKAKLVILTIPDIDEACFVIRKAKRFNKKIKIFARVSSMIEEKEVCMAGADLIMVSKILTGHEIIRRLDEFLRKSKI